MHAINEDFKSLNRMTRPPIFKWAKDESTSDEIPNAYDT
jgi:hypothetical protein